MRWSWLFLSGCQLAFPREDNACDPTDTVRYPIQLPTRISGYREGRQALNWLDAEADCELDGRGAHLFAPFDTSELGDFQRFSNLPPPIGGTWWAGVSRKAGTTTNDFFSVIGDAVPASSTLWQEGEPTGGGELVVRFEAGSGLFDAPEDARNDYVCECDGQTPTNTELF